MQEPKDIFELASDTKEATQLYVKYKIDYYKLHVAERLTTFATFAIGGIILLALMALFLLFTSLALAMFLGDMLGNIYLGYFIVGILYLIGIGLLLMLRGRFIQRPILKIVIAELFSKPKNDRA